MNPKELLERLPKQCLVVSEGPVSSYSYCGTVEEDNNRTPNTNHGFFASLPTGKDLSEADFDFFLIFSHELRLISVQTWG
jgi:hypothetical protein